MNIIDASGHCKVIIEALLSSGEVIEKIYDDDEAIKSILGYEVSHDRQSIDQSVKSKFIIAVGNNMIRQKIVDEMRLKFGNSIHKEATISRSAVLGVGNAFMAKSVINAQVHISDHCIVNTGAVIDHDCKLSSFVHVAPSATLCGGVIIGKSTLVGAGSVITPNRTIG